MGKRICNQLRADIVEEILLQLPLKSVLRFKCISKSWRSSISSKLFIRVHLNKSKTGNDFTHHNLIFTYHKTHSFLSRNIRTYEPIPSLGPNPSSISIPSFKDNNRLFFLGSCNGLILVDDKCRGLYLWNPSIRKAKRILSPLDIISLKRDSWNCRSFTLGYNESTDDYKVIRVLYSSYSFRGEIHMYSWRSDSWKKTRNVDKGSLPGPSAKFVNGRLYWLTRKRVEKDDEGWEIEDDGSSDGRGWYIVSLDLVEEEKYQFMVPPQCFGGRNDNVLEDLGGYLSLICYKYSERSTNVCETAMNIWVMKNGAWSNILTLSFNYFGPRPNPLCLKKNGDIVVGFGSDVIIYRGNDKLCQSSVDMFDDRIESVVCVESLVWPFGDDD